MGFLTGDYAAGNRFSGIWSAVPARLGTGVLAVLLLLTVGQPALADGAATPLEQRANEVVRLFSDDSAPTDIFTEEFLDLVPVPTLHAICAQLRALYGSARGLARIDTQSATSAVIHVDFDSALLQMNLVIEPVAPHRIAGLLVTGAEVRDDSLPAIAEEVRLLSGRAGFVVARLTDTTPEVLAGCQAERAMAIGSTFKLFVLAELARAITAGERRWDEVVALDRCSLPSGVLQQWPPGSPMTLHTLATLMISQSDNTATDMLLAVLGRAPVERMMKTIGVQAADRNRPLLSTLEFFALKVAPETAFQVWRDGDEPARRRLLAADYAAIRSETIDATWVAGPPLRIETIEWFASPSDLVRTMEWLHRNGDETTHAILAINPGIPSGAARQHHYVGYKGGAEPGVCNGTWLIGSGAGAWYVVAGSWNDPRGSLEVVRLLGLLGRAVQQLR